MHIRTCVPALLAAAVCFGCSFETNEEFTSDEIAMSEEAIGEATCATLSPDRTMTGRGWTIETPTTYDRQGCTRAYILQANAVPLDTTISLRWNGSLPTDPTACANARVFGYLYRRQGSTWTLIGERQTGVGLWQVDGVCRVQSVFFFVGSGDYKVVASARKSPSGPTRSLAISASTTIF